MQDNIPKDALGVYFEYGKTKGHIWTWAVVRNREVRYQWACLGNNGEEASREDAIKKARVWIIYGQVQ